MLGRTPQEANLRREIGVSGSTNEGESASVGGRVLAPLAQSNARLALAVGVVALVVRLACYNELSASTFVKYPFHAAFFLRGEGEASRAFTCSPLYLYYWVGVAKLLGGSLAVGRVVQLSAGALNCALIALIGKALFDWRAGLLSGLAGALYLPFVVHDGTFVSATWVVLLNLLSIGGLLWHRRRPGAGLPLGGLALGLSACARPNALLLAPFFGYWALSPWRRSGARLRVSIVGGVVFGATVLAPPALVTARNYWVARDFVPVMSDGGIVFYLGNNEMDNGFMYTWPRYEDLFFVRPGEVDPTHRVAHEIAERETGRHLKPSESSAWWTAQAVRFVRERPLQWMWLAARKVAYTWTGFEAHDVAAAFDAQDALLRRHCFLHFASVGALGLIGAVWFRRRVRELLPLYGLLVTYTLTGALFTVVARYRIPMVPALLWFGAGLVVALAEAARGRAWGTVGPVLAAAVCLSGVMSYRNYPMRALDAQYRVERDHLGPAEGALRKGRFDEAQVQLEAAIAARATFVTVCRAHGLLAVTYEALGDETSAEKHRAAGRGYVRDPSGGELLLPPPELAGDPVYGLWMSAADELRGGQSARGAHDFRRLCTWVPNLGPAHHCLGLALIEAGRRREGLRELRLARMRDPSCEATHEALVREADGPPEALVAEYRDLVRANPGQSGFEYGLSLAQAKAQTSRPGGGTSARTPPRT
jgi:hypothetical protein